MVNNSTVCFVGGKSGGHIVPCLTLAEHLKKQSPHSSAIFISTTHLLDRSIIKHSAAIRAHYCIPLHSVPHTIGSCVRFSLDFLRSTINAYRILKQHSVSTVVTTGGIVALPVACAALLRRCPVELYELNAIPGRAARVLAHCATSIFVCFERAQGYFSSKKCSVVPYPLRSLPAKPTPSLGKTVLVWGGSQGSQFINNVVLSWARSTVTPIRIFHQVGAQNLKAVQDEYHTLAHSVTVFSYTNDIAALYNKADLVICRSGAGTLFEAAHFNKPCITIPLEHVANNHQVYNAYAIAEQYQHFTVLRQKALERNDSLFHTAVNTLLSLP